MRRPPNPALLVWRHGPLLGRQRTRGCWRPDGGRKLAHFYRAILEGITFDKVMRTRALEEASGQTIDYYVAIGGGAGNHAVEADAGRRFQ